jgi:hypothetical protein
MGGYGRFCRGCRVFGNRSGYPYGYGYGWPYWGYGPDVWPVYDWDYGDYGGYTADSGSAAQFQSELANQQSLNAQLEDELNAERLRRIQQDAAAPAQFQARSKPAEEAEEPASPDTVLVFRDGSRTEVQNYAIVGQTLFDFGPHGTRKILLTDLNVPATVKANDDRGVQFVLPVKAKGL